MNRQEAIPHNPEADSFDLKKSIETIKQAIGCHKKLIAATTITSVVVVMLYMMLFPAIYQAEVVLIGDSPTDIQREEFYNHWSVFRKAPLPDEVELMTSGIVIGKVVDKMDLKYEDVYHSFSNHVGYLWIKSWIGRAYRAVKFWIFPKNSPYNLTPEQIERGKTINSFKDGVGMRPVPDTNLGVLVLRGPSPRVADVANTLMEVYLNERKSRLIEEGEIAYNSLKAEVDKTKEELVVAETSLQKHYVNNNMLLAFEKDKLQVTSWLAIQGSIVELESQLSSATKVLNSVDSQLKKENKEVVTGKVLQKSEAYVSFKRQITQLRITLEQMRDKFNDDAPEVVEVKNQIATLEDMLKNEDQEVMSQSTVLANEVYQNLLARKSQSMADIEGLKANLEVKRAAEQEMSATLQTLPEKMKRTRDLEREYEIIEKKYIALSDKLMIAAVSRATVNSAPPAIRVVDYAKYPEKPYWPNTKFMLLGAIVFGAFFGVIAALLIDFIYGSVSRYRLSIARGKHQIYAIVSRDHAHLSTLFDLKSAPENKPSS